MDLEVRSWTEISSEAAADLLRRRGLDPDRVVADPEPFDPDAWRVEQARRALDAAIPARFRAATVDHPQARAWVQTFAVDPGSASSVLLAGEPGTGKTHLAYAMLRAGVMAATGDGRRVTFRAITHPELNRRLRAAIDGGHEHVLAAFLDVDLLLLDDLGSGLQSDWTVDNLHQLVDRRWSEQRPTIYTTNLGPDDLAKPKSLGERLASRVFDSTRIVLGGPDRRRS